MEILGANAIFALVLFWVAYRYHAKHYRRIWKRVDVYLADLNKRIVELSKSLTSTVHCMNKVEEQASLALSQVKAVINLDVGIHRDCGWLVLITRVNGQDRVMLQELKPVMNMSEYRDLVERLKHDCGAVLRYVDAPFGTCEAFLTESRGFRRSQR